MIRRPVFMGLTLVAMIAALALPVALAVHFSGSRVLDDAESLRVLGYARDVLRRSEGAAQQIEASIKDLLVTGAADPCAPANVARMREIDRSADFIHGIGYVKDDQFLCSSFGSDAQPLRIGPVDYKTRFARLRYSVEFPFAPGRHFAVVEQGGYAAVVDKDVSIEATRSEKDATLATFSASNGRPLAVRGFVRPEWITAHDNLETTFFDRGYVVAVIHSRRWDLGAMAALPSAHPDQSAPSGSLFIGLAAIAGFGLAFAVFRASRRWQGRSARS